MAIDKLKNRFANGAWLTNVKEYFTKINEIIDYVNNNSSASSYKVYTALLSQSGTDAPISIELTSTFTQAPILTREATGMYTLTSSDIVYQKTVVFISPLGSVELNSFIQCIQDNGFLNIRTGNLTDNFADNCLLDISIEIRVYN